MQIKKNIDLFGRAIPTRPAALTQWLKRYDSSTFEERRVRAMYLRSIYPRGYSFLLPPESHYVLQEAKAAYVNGLFVATVMLAQAFIEHLLQSHLEHKGHAVIAHKGLGAIIKYMMKNEPEHGFLIKKVDAVRKFRNPFTHLRNFDDPDTLMQHVIRTHQPPDEVLKQEAEKALVVMYQMAITKL